MNIKEKNEEVNDGFYDQVEDFDENSKNNEDFKIPEKKNKEVEPPTLEYLYITRVDKFKKEVVDNYRKADANIFGWTGEYWKVLTKANIESEINYWLKSSFPNQLNSKKLHSIFNIFCINVKEFESPTYTELIIPTKKHWLLIDQNTGNITAIKPIKDIPMKYQVNVTIYKKGDYSPKSLPDNFLFSRYIKSSLVDESSRKLVQEYCGLSLTNTNRKQKAQAWIGSGANGKSQLIEMLQSIHPHSVSVKLSSIAKYNDRLIGSSLIFASEMDKGCFDQEFFKGAVSGDCVEIRGIFGTPVQSVITAKWILIGNNMPSISDFSNGLFRRLQIINWSQSFDEDSKDKVEDLAKKVIKDELDIFLDWCLYGLQNLIKADWNFTKSENTESALEEFKLNQDKVKLFFSEIGIKYSDDHTRHIAKDSIFDSFNDWSRANNFALMNSTNFWVRIRNIYPKLSQDSPDIKKNNKRICYLYVPVEDEKPVRQVVKLPEPNPEDAPDFDPFKDNGIVVPAIKDNPIPAKKLQSFGLTKATK